MTWRHRKALPEHSGTRAKFLPVLLSNPIAAFHYMQLRPPEKRFRFKSVTAIEPPEKVATSSSFHFGVEENSQTSCRLRKSGDEKLPATLRFSESNVRANQS